MAYGFNFGNPGLTAIESVIVTFTISGGRNGDLYACLSRGTDTLVLLNRVGVANGTSGSTLYSYGYSGAGFNSITLSDSGSELGNIHNYGGSTLNTTPTMGGTYKADGQSVNPLNAPTGFDAGGGTITFYEKFGGDNPNDEAWTLFFADLSGGSVATLDSWSVGITAVPEPVNVALGILGGIGAAVSGVRLWRARRQSPLRPATTARAGYRQQLQ